MDSLDTNWKIHLKKCPHCDNLVLLNGESVVNKKMAVWNLFNKMKSHLKEKCPLRARNYFEKKLVDVSIVITSKKENLNKISYEAEKILV